MDLSRVAYVIARSGVGTLTLVDADEVASSNINRQLPALTTTMGRLKTEVIAERIIQINPECKVTLRSEFYQPGDFDKFFSEKLDFVNESKIEAALLDAGLVYTYTREYIDSEKMYETHYESEVLIDG